MAASRSRSPASWAEQPPNARSLRAGHPALAWPGRQSPHSPVEEVVAAHHPEEARGVGHGVELVVHLLTLLVHDVSGFALRLAAGAGPGAECGDGPSESGGVSAGVYAWSCATPPPNEPLAPSAPLRPGPPVSPQLSPRPSSLCRPVLPEMCSGWLFLGCHPHGAGHSLQQESPTSGPWGRGPVVVWSC